MNKNVLSLALLISVFFITSCSFWSDPEPVTPPPVVNVTTTPAPVVEPPPVVTPPVVTPPPVVPEKPKNTTYLDEKGDAWIRYADGTEFQLTKNAGRTDICGGGRVLSYNEPVVLSDDARFALLISVCPGDPNEIFVKEISSYTSKKIANGDRAEFKIVDGVEKILVDGKDLYENPFLPQTYTNQSKGIQVSFTGGFDVKNNAGVEYVEFGPSMILNEGGPVRIEHPYSLTFGEPRSAETAIREIKAELEFFTIEPTLITVAGFQVIKYMEGALCGQLRLEVIGKKSNYTLSFNCGGEQKEQQYMESVIKTFVLLP